MIKNIDELCRELENGVTAPLEGRIGENPVFVKSKNCYFADKALSSELVCLHIAERLKLTIPNGGICEIDEDTRNNIDDIYIEEHFGYGFYSEQVKGAVEFASVPEEAIEKIENKEEILTTILFDCLIYNKDRSEYNMLLNMKDKKFYIIDHSHVFNSNKWGEGSIDTFCEKDMLSVNKEVYLLFKNTIRAERHRLKEVVETIQETLSTDVISEIFEKVPSFWLSKENKVKLINYIEHRRDNLEIMGSRVIEELLKEEVNINEGDFCSIEI